MCGSTAPQETGIMPSGDDGSQVYQVPYFSQWESPELVPEFLSGRTRASDDPQWRGSGAVSAAEYEFWSPRACGVACLRMLLSWWRGGAPPVMPLIRECVEAGAYVVRDDGVDGLIYAPFCEYLRTRWDLIATLKSPLDLQSCASELDSERFAIISVHPAIRDRSDIPASRGGHLVLVVGRWTEGLIIHNPSGIPGVSQQFYPITFDSLPHYFAGRGIFVGNA